MKRVHKRVGSIPFDHGTCLEETLGRNALHKISRIEDALGVADSLEYLPVRTKCYIHHNRAYSDAGYYAEHDPRSISFL
jgi:hypothetical protein